MTSQQATITHVTTETYWIIETKDGSRYKRYGPRGSERWWIWMGGDYVVADNRDELEKQFREFMK